jgi:hypothetical protein
MGYEILRPARRIPERNRPALHPLGGLRKAPGVSGEFKKIIEMAGKIHDQK